MKIYQVSTNENVGYDEYDSVVVIAKTEAKAIEIAKAECWNFSGSISMEEIGTAKRGSKEGVVLASFNAG